MDNFGSLEDLKRDHNELIIKHKELLKCSASLSLANKELIIQHADKDKRTIELSLANDSLEKSQTQQKEHIQGLKKMLFMISHNMRQPIAHILGLSNIIEKESKLAPNTKEMLVFMKQAALSLDNLTKELAAFIEEKKIDSENVV
ncbi:MAG: arcB [Bacteroidetes bacterium]|jgi:signal transduction histidine kinase|nr:arcB [Bacteroidota bacterium]